MLQLLRPTALIALTALAVTACARKRAQPDIPTFTVNTEIDPAQRDSIGRAEARRDSLARAEALLGEERARRLAEARATVIEPIHFDYNRSELTPDARRILDAKVPILNGNPDLRLRLDGHTDERGSADYNLALGQRRAAAAHRHLVWLGVPANRLEMASFGEERPTCEASEESCWSRNRRVEFEIMAGAASSAVR
jgi:peptidoglycan-associated lipoprotein